MTAVGKLLSHHDGKMVTQQAKRSQKPTGQKTALLTTAPSRWVSHVSMSIYEPTAVSYIGSTVSNHDAAQWGGV